MTLTAPVAYTKSAPISRIKVAATCLVHMFSDWCPDRCTYPFNPSNPGHFPSMILIAKSVHSRAAAHTATAESRVQVRNLAAFTFLCLLEVFKSAILLPWLPVLFVRSSTTARKSSVLKYTIQHRLYAHHFSTVTSPPV